MRSRTSRFSPCTLHFKYRHLREKTSTHYVPNTAFDPYSYSRGRWLDRNEQRQTARRLDFNSSALLDVAVSCSHGAREVVACEKREGGFNRAFIVELDNGIKVVAKVPMQFACPAALTTMSEVATLRYGNCHSNHLEIRIMS